MERFQRGYFWASTLDFSDVAVKAAMAGCAGYGWRHNGDKSGGNKIGRITVPPPTNTHDFNGDGLSDAETILTFSAPANWTA